MCWLVVYMELSLLDSMSEMCVQSPLCSTQSGAGPVAAHKVAADAGLSVVWQQNKIRQVTGGCQLRVLCRAAGGAGLAPGA